MGLSYLAVACSIEELESVYSSRDEALHARILASEDSSVRHYLKVSAPVRRGLGETPGPLHDIFVGAAPTRYEPFRYAYALFACAYVLGTDLGESMGGYGRQGEAMCMLSELGEVEDPLPDLGLAWPIPGLPTIADWPAYMAYPAEEVERRAVVMKGMMERISPVPRTGETAELWRFV